IPLTGARQTGKGGKVWNRLAFDPANWLRQMRFSPALASAILILGFAGGVGTAYRLVGHPASSTTTATSTPTAPNSEASITGISSVTQDPVTNQINIKYNT